MTQHFRHIGRRMPSLDAEAKATGQLAYTQDIVRPGMLHGLILRSPHAHARIVSIDLSAAAGMPGVHAMVCGRDYPGGQYINFGAVYTDRYPLALDTVRYKGEDVAAVAAESLEQARAALQAIRITYEPLAPVFEPEAALAADAPLLHPQRNNLPANVAQHAEAVFGDLDAAFRDAAVVVSNTFSHGAVAPICMETNAVVAEYDAASGQMQIWTGSQAPFFARKEVAHVLGLPLQQVVIRASGIGGGFGGKSQSPEPVAVAALLSFKASRPVRIVLDRREEFISGKTDHPKTMTVSTAVAADGSILGRRTQYYVDNGAYTMMGPAYISAVRQRTCNLYRVGAAGFDGKLVYTNKVPGGSYRGMGAPQIIWAIETQIDEIARKLGRDRLEYRMQIANRPGDITPLGWKIGSCAMAECIAEAGRRIGWAEKSKNRKPWRGLGIAAMINPSVGVLYPEGNFANVSLELRPDGRILLGTQTADCGTAQNTVLAQFAAEAMDVDLGCFDVLHMDTENAPDDLGSAASRVTFVSGAAAIVAGKEMVAAIKARLAERWAAAPEDIDFRDGIAGLRGDNSRRMSLAEFAAAEAPLKVVGRHDIELPRADPKTGYGHYAPAYGFGALAVEVEVDPGTGAVTILKIVSVQDIGRVINPLALEGQVQGGILQGIGMALQEELVFDDGEPVNASLISYKVPRIFQTPNIEMAFIETGEPNGPFGAKAGGEHPINMTVAAIANAITDATGIQFTSLPITPQKILDALVRRDGAMPQTRPWTRPYNLEVATARALYPTVLFPGLKKLGAAIGRPVKQPRKSEFVPAREIGVALSLLAEAKGEAKLMAGGTDLQVGMRQGVYAPRLVIDISGITALRGVTEQGDALRIGAGTTLSAIIRDPLVRRHFPLLAEGLRQTATQQIRHVATLAGDLCQEKRCWFFRSAKQCYKHGGATCPCYAVLGDSRHHSIMGAGRCAAPCVADAAPMLVALGARAEALGPQGTRFIAMEEFYRWSGETALAADEMLVALHLPLAAAGLRQHFEKFAMWRGDFAEASVAVVADVAADGRMQSLRMAYGGVAPLPMRAKPVESRLLGQRMTEDAIQAAASHCADGALPLRENAAKVPLLQTLVARSLAAIATQATGH